MDRCPGRQAGITAKTIRSTKTPGLMPHLLGTRRRHTGPPDLPRPRCRSAAGVIPRRPGSRAQPRRDPQHPGDPRRRPGPLPQHVTDLIDGTSPRSASAWRARPGPGRAPRPLKSRASATDRGRLPARPVFFCASILTMTQGGTQVAVNDDRTVPVLAAGSRDGERDRGRAGLAEGIRTSLVDELRTTVVRPGSARLPGEAVPGWRPPCSGRRSRGAQGQLAHREAAGEAEALQLWDGHGPYGYTARTSRTTRC